MPSKHRFLSAVAAAALGFTVVACGERSGHATPAHIPESLSRDGSSVVIGGPTAKTKVRLSMDPLCRLCGEFEATGAGPELLAMTQRGEVQVQYTFTASSGVASEKIVNALRAALAEDKFVEYHKALRDGLATMAARGVDEAELLALASRVPGLRGDRFDTAVRTMKYRSFVAVAGRAGQDSASPGKPTMEINGVPLPEHLDDTILFDGRFLTRYMNEVVNAGPA